MKRRLYDGSFAGKVMGLMVGVCLYASPLLAQTPTPFFSEGFDAVSIPVLPGGWQDAAGIWQTDDGVASPGSGGNNLRIRGSVAGTVQTHLQRVRGEAYMDVQEELAAGS